MRRRGPLIAVAVVAALATSAVLTRGAGLPGEPESPAGGAALFATEFRPEQGLGPLFNATACVACHDEPVAGGMGRGSAGAALRVGRLAADGFDPLDGRGGPVARARGVAELGAACPLAPGIPP